MPLTPAWLLSLIEEHYEELQMLWELRCDAVRDLDYDASDLAEMDERIVAHLDGLVISQEHVLPVVVDGLSDSDRSVVFASALFILHTAESGESEAMQTLWDALDAADSEGADGFCDALACAGADRFRKELEERLTSTHQVASVAARALAFAGLLKDQFTRVTEFLVDDDEFIRRRGWEIVSLRNKNKPSLRTRS